MAQTEIIPEDAFDIRLEPPMRWHHLSGGLAVLVGANRLAMLMSPGGPGVLFFSLLGNTHIVSALKPQSGIRALGGTQFNHADEMHDPVTSNFMISAADGLNRCLAHAQFYHWSGIAVALHSMGRESEAMMASRLNSQIRLCKERLERLSAAYRTVLSIVGPQYEARPGLSFTADKYAQYIGSEYRSLLNELYSLRDAILAVAYRIKYQHSDPYTLAKIKQCVTSEESGAGKLIAASMFSDEVGIIERMSLYRSVAQHCLGTNNPASGDMYKIACASGPYGLLPYLIFPLYDDIKMMRSIEQGSSKGALEKVANEEVIRFLSLPTHLDALEFTYDCFVYMLRICEALAKEIGIEPKTVTLTDQDIIEATFTDEQGNITRIKRDEKTGELKKY